MQKKWLSYFGILTCATLHLGAEEVAELQESETEMVGEVALNDNYLAARDTDRGDAADSEKEADKIIDDANKFGKRAADKARTETRGTAEEKERAAHLARNEVSARYMRDHVKGIEKAHPVAAMFLRGRIEARDTEARLLKEHPEMKMRDILADSRDHEARFLDNHADDEKLTDREREDLRTRALRTRMEARAWREGPDVRTREDIDRRRDDVRREGDRQVRVWRSLSPAERRVAFGEGVHDERAKSYYFTRWTAHFGDHHDARKASMEAHDDLGRRFDERAKEEDRKGNHMEAILLRSRGEGEKEEVRALREGKSPRDARVRKFERIAVSQGKELKDHGRELSTEEKTVVEVHIRGNAERADNERRMPEGRGDKDLAEVRRLRRENHTLERDLREAREHPEKAEHIRNKNPKLRAKASSSSRARAGGPQVETTK